MPDPETSPGKTYLKPAQRLINLSIVRSHHTRPDRLVARQLVHRSQPDVEATLRIVHGRKDHRPVAVTELPARPAVGGVEVGWEGTSDVWERGEAVEGREPWCRGRVSG